MKLECPLDGPIVQTLSSGKEPFTEKCECETEFLVGFKLLVSYETVEQFCWQSRFCIGVNGPLAEHFVNTKI